ncbi:Ribosomal protein S2, mitochondrial [Zostera marina]|uniref:Ribosomal protein S2, mitochondrial n=1 Tax=Zostera marina TaxID=29655 RepID=A0A0K9Q5L0_ZOSMR|nr:Ribosomal protein S2, mitochondrial [Zostera marina]
MVNQYLAAQKLLGVCAHLSRPPASQHFKPFIIGSRNNRNVIDLDKTSICLRNAMNFIGSLIHQRGRVFFLRTKNDIHDEILSKMATKIGCTHNSQMGIPGYSTFTPGLAKNSSKKIKINFSGSHQKPDCYVILGSESSDRKHAVIQEADRSQIPTVCLVDTGMPMKYFEMVTYPIPAIDSTQFVYLFCNLVTKTVLRDRENNDKEKNKSRILTF